MSRSLIVLLIVFLLQSNDVLRGDINQDGLVNILDITILVLVILENRSAPQPGTDDFIRHDMNGDGQIDISDVIRQVNLMLNIPS